MRDPIMRRYGEQYSEFLDAMKEKQANSSDN